MKEKQMAVYVTRIFPDSTDEVKRNYLVRQLDDGKWEARIYGSWVALRVDKEGRLTRTFKVGTPKIRGV